MEYSETDRNDFKNLLQKILRESEKRRERRSEQEEEREKERQKEQWRQIREAAEQVDTLVMDAAVMQTWRKRVRETLDSSRGIKTGEDLLATLADERRNVGAFYTVLAFCHDDVFWSGVAPIITDDIRNLNPQLCSRPGMCDVYYPRQRWCLLDIYLLHVMRDLGVLPADLGAERKTRNSKPEEPERKGKPDGKPVAPPELNDTEQNIIEALNTNTLTGEELCNKAGYPLNSNFKSTLSSLRKRGILGNKSPGYFLESQYRFLLENSDQGQD